ncbi:MAG: Asp-tRNA(Asn)/Glu-tRNA(Gln) amidotransferase subunit GatA [Nitrospinae bacterium]|nr:Asp-tRNA(Asn)/Glu-tRNA(Gln) amidotransferase subunit GatA [Nitrospinota bacterium]
MAELHNETIASLSRKLAAGETTSAALTKNLLERIERLDPQVKAFLRVEKEDALAQAADADKRRAAGEKGPLLGIPVAVKDNIAIEDRLTTCASKILENFRAPYSATVVKKLRGAGAVLIGKTNLDEFAMGSSTENSAFFTTRNPWDLNAVPGGSSGGSAAAVAAGFAPASLGSDTGGSIRQPASLCGVVGLKPTYGRISRFGLVAFASSLDQIGPFARTVEDTALLMNVLAGHDPLDSTSVDMPVPDYAAALKKDVKGMVIGLPKEYLVGGIDPAVETVVKTAAERLAKEGARIEEISLPHTEYGISVYYVIATAEASSNLARYDGVRYGHRSKESHDLAAMYVNSRSEGFGPEVKRRIMLGTYTLSSGYYDAYYLKAQKARTLILNDFRAAFKKCNVILTPTAPTPAFTIGEKADNPLQMYLSDIFTISANLAGIPGISVPGGFAPNGRPIGVQLMAAHFGEETLFTAAAAYERLRDAVVGSTFPKLG